MTSSKLSKLLAALSGKGAPPSRQPMLVPLTESAADTAIPPHLPSPISHPLSSYPPVEQWDDWVEYDPKAWPRKVPRRYTLVPTVCFNCESACGLLGYVDKETLNIQKFEGNPAHPGSRGRNCAKGPATLNQVTDPERIKYPLRRVGPRGGGRWERVTWDEVLDDIGGRIRKALVEGRQKEIMYHLGRPGRRARHRGQVDDRIGAVQRLEGGLGVGEFDGDRSGRRVGQLRRVLDHRPHRHAIGQEAGHHPRAQVAGRPGDHHGARLGLEIHLHAASLAERAPSRRAQVHAVVGSGP